MHKLPGQDHHDVDLAVQDPRSNYRNVEREFVFDLIRRVLVLGVDEQDISIRLIGLTPAKSRSKVLAPTMSAIRAWICRSWTSVSCTDRR